MQVSGGQVTIVTDVLRVGPDLRPPEGFPALDGLLCSASATAIIQCPSLIASCATSGPTIGWEDPLADQEDTGHDPWGAYGAFEDDGDCAWAFDDNCFRGD